MSLVLLFILSADYTARLEMVLMLTMVGLKACQSWCSVPQERRVGIYSSTFVIILKLHRTFVRAPLHLKLTEKINSAPEVQVESALHFYAMMLNSHKV